MEHNHFLRLCSFLLSSVFIHASPRRAGGSVQMIIDMAITDLLHFRHDIVTCCSSFKKE